MPSYFCKILTEIQKILKKCKNSKIGRLTEERGSAKINWLEKWRRKEEIGSAGTFFCFMAYF